ncbi:MAG: DsrE/DsrF/DrsH-like family protein [Treponema sp.]|nr:DsrE/DsrF/DrsH-like family protein [Treponema sp.]
MEEVKSITNVEFTKLNKSEYTILDVRDEAEIIVHPISGTVNIPFQSLLKNLSSHLAQIPKDKPVVVICRTGDTSEQIAELLLDHGYDVYNLEGGTKSLESQTESNDDNQKKSVSNEPVFIDAKGLKCPGPIVKVSDTLKTLKNGQQVFVQATEDAFASDIKVWCQRTNNILEKLEIKEGVIEALVTKNESNAVATGSGGSSGNDKTFVVFSGDLDKAIAAFIMANGAAAMGRKITVFFTFWGLNILRKAKRVHVRKNLIEKMFGAMMPRGSKKLGLSRMNMGGMGAKMIRWVMKNKNVSSLEELMQNAIAHGVRIVACQMSMDIMGIRKEELVDGVELGGVATFLGSCETSDATLFI